MSIKIHSIFLAACSLVLAASCDKQSIDLNPTVQITAGYDDGDTKATLVNSESSLKSVYGKFYASIYKGTTVFEAGPVTFSYKTAGEWTASKTMFWPINGSTAQPETLTFGAWSSDTEAEGITAHSYNVTGTSTFSYTLVQKDIVFGYYKGTGSTAHPGRAPITFSHPLSSIKLVMGTVNTGYTIKTLKLKQVYKTGKCSFKFAAAPTYTWSDQATKATINVCSTAITELPATGTKLGNTVILVPQTCPEGAIIEAVITADDGEDHTITASIEGDTFAPGHTKVYQLEIGKRTFIEVKDIDSWEMDSSMSTVDRQVTELGTTESANCYIIPASEGFYKFPCVKGNDKTQTITAKSAAVLWETINTTTAPEVGSVVWAADIGEDGNVYIYTKGTTPGNAVVAVYSGAYDSVTGLPTGNILWSWHIWKSATPGDILFKKTSKSLMDRNLGALSGTVDNARSNGLLYEWGRKDPFPGNAVLSKTAQMMATARTSIGRISATDAQGSSSNNLTYSIRHPQMYIHNLVGGTGKLDWYSKGSTQNNNLWGATKTIYDPCPPGYKVPEGDFFEKAMQINSSYGTSKSYYAESYKLYRLYEDAGFPDRDITVETPSKSSGNGYAHGIYVNQTDVSTNAWTNRVFWVPMVGLMLTDSGMINSLVGAALWTSETGGYDAPEKGHEGDPINFHAEYARVLDVNASNYGATRFHTYWGSNRAAGSSVRCQKL